MPFAYYRRLNRAQPHSYAHPMFWAPFVIVGNGC